MKNSVSHEKVNGFEQSDVHSISQNVLECLLARMLSMPSCSWSQHCSHSSSRLSTSHFRSRSHSGSLNYYDIVSIIILSSTNKPIVLHSKACSIFFSRLTLSQFLLVKTARDANNDWLVVWGYISTSVHTWFCFRHPCHDGNTLKPTLLGYRKPRCLSTSHLAELLLSLKSSLNSDNILRKCFKLQIADHTATTLLPQLLPVNHIWLSYLRGYTGYPPPCISYPAHRLMPGQFSFFIFVRLRRRETSGPRRELPEHWHRITAVRWSHARGCNPTLPRKYYQHNLNRTKYCMYLPTYQPTRFCHNSFFSTKGDKSVRQDRLPRPRSAVYNSPIYYITVAVSVTTAWHECHRHKE
jgi:hypothetical protein